VLMRVLHLFTQLLGQSNRPDNLLTIDSIEESHTTPVTSRPTSRRQGTGAEHGPMHSGESSGEDWGEDLAF